MSESAKEQEVVAAVMEWVLEVIPELEGHYDYAVSGKSEALPDVVIEVERAARTLNDPQFPYAQLQNVTLDVFDLLLSFMVSNTDPRAAALWLRDVGYRLREQIGRDVTLGQRVFMTSPQVEVDYVPQFAEYEDGTRGRQAVARISVCNPVEDS